MLKLSCQREAQSPRAWRSSWSIRASSAEFETRKSLVSSANKRIFECLITSGRSRIKTEKPRSQNRALGKSRCYWSIFWLATIQDNPLLSTSQPLVQPLEKPSSNSYWFHFC
jgi:hypothetical protein